MRSSGRIFEYLDRQDVDLASIAAGSDATGLGSADACRVEMERSPTITASIGAPCPTRGDAPVE